MATCLECGVESHGTICPKCFDASLDDNNQSSISPSHYTSFKIPPNVYITENNLLWEEGNICKYITRHRFKNGKEDCLKAGKYLTMLIERLYGEKYEIVKVD